MPSILITTDSRTLFSPRLIATTLPEAGAVKITSSLYNDREGIYYIDSIKKKFSRDGYRQEIELGPTFVK